MGHTNQTANYNLPQFVGTDKPSWLGDINDAFAAIDTAIAAAASEASTADGKADALTTTVSGHTTQLGTLQNTVTSQGNTLNTVTALIGNGTPTTTDHTIIGAINELHADQGDLASLTTTDKSSLVAAINEAAQGGGGTETIRYDAVSEYIQCKDALGWFNWRKASREVWNAILDSSIITSIANPAGNLSPAVVTVVNDAISITTDTDHGGSIYVSPEASGITVHMDGSYINNSADTGIVGYCDSWSGNTAVNPVTVATIAANGTTSLNLSFAVPANKYVFMSINRQSTITINEFWAS